MKKRLSLILLCMVATIAAWAQTVITGTVVSAADGEPLIGASVKVKGEKTGSVTDLNGKFKINVEAGKTLVFSYIAMEAVERPAKNGMYVEMRSIEETMDEVMVIAYGTQKRSAFTGSASVVNTEDIAKVQATNFADALKGKASGVQISTASGQPGGGSTIRIRGFNSIRDNAMAPLIVVDGVPFEGDLNDINTQDIESIVVQKDAASSALYGARGGNGVIMVTTKSAKKGQDARVTFDAKWGSNMKGKANYDRIMNPAAYYETYYQKLKNYAMATTSGSANGLGMNEQDAWRWANQKLIDDTEFGLRYNVFSYPEGQYLIGQDGKVNPNATLGRVVMGGDGNEYYITPDNWEDEIYHNGLRQEYNLGVSGSTDRSTYYASANYLSHKGITYNSGYERFTGRVKADFQAKKWLRFTTDLNYSHFNRDYVDGDGDGATAGNMFALQNIAPIYPVFYRDAKGNILMHEESGIKAYDYGDITMLGLVRPYLNQANPISDLLVNTSNTEGNTFRGVGTIDVYLPYGFTFTSTNSVYLSESRGTSITNPWFGQYKSNNGTVSKGHDRQFDLTFAQRLNWHQTYGKHDVEVMLGHEYFNNRVYELSGSRSNMSSQSNKELAGAINVQSTNSAMYEYNTESWMGRAMYNYADRYFAYASIMRQASSAFHPKHRWGTFWSASAGWMLSKENWFKVKWIDELKLKASYGENGNDQGMWYSYLYTNMYSISNSNGSIALTPSSTKGNEEISWEKNAKFNVGLDFSLFKGRLSGTLEYYNNSTVDMLSTIPYPPTLGYTHAYANVGNMSNQGFEVELRGDIIRTRDFTWDIYANISTNSNKITKLHDEHKKTEVDGYFGYSSSGYYYTEGLSRYTYYGNMYAGVYNEETYALTGDEAYDPAKGGLAMYYKNVYKTDAEGNVLKDENGVRIVEKKIATTTYSESDQYVGKDMLAKAFGGFGTGFQWKGLDLSVDFQYQIGGLTYDGEYQSLMAGSAGYGIHQDVLNAWTPENSSSNIPRFQASYTGMTSSSDRWLTDASYLTLGNITLGYSFDKKLLKKIHLENLRLYLVADNIYTWSKRKGLDPRQSMTGGSDAMMYSPIRTFSCGVNVTF
ncbi:MAG: TonB-dependent receptor [Bacteroidaceae bacterium]|nr:TonB-dependent receptor [Bacteroidaceae bacterium]